MAGYTLLMVALNEIPDSLKEPTRDLEWTLARGLTRGTVATLIAGVVLGGLLLWLGCAVRILALHWLMCIVQGFLIVWILCAVMHSASGTIGASCTSIVLIFTVLVVAAKHYGIAMSVASEMTPPASAWSLFSASEMATLNLSTWLGAAIAAYLCHHGDGIGSDIVNLLRSNPLYRGG